MSGLRAPVVSLEAVQFAPHRLDQGAAGVLQARRDKAQFGVEAAPRIVIGARQAAWTSFAPVRRTKSAMLPSSGPRRA